MKNFQSIYSYTLSFLLILFLINEVQAQDSDSDIGVSNNSISYKAMGNPYLPLWEHLPDGEPRVFEDPDNPGKYRAYIIGSHDVRYTSYCGPDIRIWSAPVENLSEWKDEGPVFTYQVDGKWDVMYAPDLVEVKDKEGTKTYYLYPHSRGSNREAMVAKGSRPDGPFIPINLSQDGKRTVPGSILGFDPAIYIEYIDDPTDPDYEIGYRAYGYWGFQKSSAAQLDQNTMYSLRPGTEVIESLLPASRRYGVIRDPEGTIFPKIYEGEDLGSFNFFEASSIRKVGNKYVTVFSGYSGPDYGVGSSNSTLRYAVADSPLGPWRSGGILVDSRAPVLNENGTAIETTYSGHNTHGSIEEINNQWYVFYNRPPRGFGFARQAMVAPITVSWDEKSVEDGGSVYLRGYDPYASDEIWRAKASNGLEYNGAEVTSEGFHIYGLDPYQYYSAGYACYLSDIGIQQDAWDIWNNHMPISDLKNGHIIGYKYFGFGGVSEDQKGVTAFEGTKEGNETKFNLFLKPQSQESFKVQVWLDGPWDNATWNGKRIGDITVPAQAKNEITQFTLDVSEFVDKLDKKHAIFFRIVGAEVESLGEFVGLGFSSKDKPINRPVVPEIFISANGKALDLPETPVRSTDENGITGYAIYETTYNVEDAASVPVLTAKSDNPDVNVNITQASSPSEEAIVKFDYKGKVKTYHVAFK